MLGVGQAVPCISLQSSGPSLCFRCPAKPSYLSCWEPQLMLPHSALYYFSFPGPPAKGTSEQLQKGNSQSTPGGVCPLLCHCSANPVRLFSVTRTLTRSCFRNTGLCSSITRQDSFLIWLGPEEKQSQIQMQQLKKPHHFNHGPTGLKNCTKCQERPLRKRGGSKEHDKDTQEEVWW